jgi:hypothetical protein
LLKNVLPFFHGPLSRKKGLTASAIIICLSGSKLVCNSHACGKDKNSLEVIFFSAWLFSDAVYSHFYKSEVRNSPVLPLAPKGGRSNRPFCYLNLTLFFHPRLIAIKNSDYL